MACMPFGVDLGLVPREESGCRSPHRIQSPQATIKRRDRAGTGDFDSVSQSFFFWESLVLRDWSQRERGIYVLRNFVNISVSILDVEDA